jgi:hypothetical protein
MPNHVYMIIVPSMMTDHGAICGYRKLRAGSWAAKTGSKRSLPTNIVLEAVSMKDVARPSKNIPGLSTGDTFYAHQ